MHGLEEGIAWVGRGCVLELLGLEGVYYGTASVREGCVKEVLWLEVSTIRDCLV